MYKKSLLTLLIISSFAFGIEHRVSAALSCSITSAAACTNPSIILLRMASSTNSHVELPTQSNSVYDQDVVCCSGLSGISNSCSGTYQVVAKLGSTTNSHIEQNTFSNFTNNACLAVPSGTITIGYQDSNCTGFDTTIASMSSSTNAHVGSPADYTAKICGTLGSTTQTLTFSISDTTIGFGTLTSSAARYASSDTLGSASEVEAHQLLVSTNAASGYTVTVQGATLTSSPYTITAIGASNTASNAGTEQFGLRLVASGGTGVVTSPYAASGFAYNATGSTASQIASATTGDSVTTTYSARYIGNASSATEVGNYSSSLIYVATANF
jgi:hypothetical protein